MVRVRILGRYKEEDNIHYSIFLCPSCGSEVERQSSNGIRQAHCGCIPVNTDHGLSHTELYYKWANMKTRCDNPKSSQYKWYGEKGITYTKEWGAFTTFKDWVDENNVYKDGLDLVLSRKDHDLGYSPDNCEFILRSDNCKEAMERRWRSKDG